MVFFWIWPRFWHDLNEIGLICGMISKEVGMIPRGWCLINSGVTSGSLWDDLRKILKSFGVDLGMITEGGRKAGGGLHSVEQSGREAYPKKMSSPCIRPDYKVIARTINIKCNLYFQINPQKSSRMNSTPKDVIALELNKNSSLRNSTIKTPSLVFWTKQSLHIVQRQIFGRKLNKDTYR